MNWAWDQQLSPTPKLILMALADAANDYGVCWPGVSTVARKCCVSVRTVRRVMQTLAARGLLLTEQRYCKDGSCSSNRYRLRLERGDKLSPAPDSGDTGPGHDCEGPPDAGDIPGTTRGTQKESPQPPGKKTKADISTPEKCGGGELSDVEYPKALSMAEREEASKKLSGIPAGLAQQLLDELAASIGANVIQTTPLAYLRGLITRAREGRFTPESGLQVAKYRKRRTEIDAAIRHNESERCNHLPAAVNRENPLVNKLLDIQKRVREKNREQG